ncbi:MAG TPA: DEAD/DEAH box helicase family protein [Allosphingosinicella sp.]
MQSEMTFQGRWRDYQQAVLDALESHLVDDKLHLVAAPGSGKTLMGLEVVRRIGRPALVLAPTVAIRNQWVARLSDMFLPAPHVGPEWISTSLADPRPLTISTYQALHAATGERPGRAAGDEQESDEAPPAEPPGRFETLTSFFRELGAITLVLDEAHHLRREWWRTLGELREALPEAKIVSLTATPPYDVEHAEWLNYEALCGPIDEEIPIPQLVRTGELCPHQDYLHVSLPATSEEVLVTAHRAGLYDFIVRLHDDRELLAILLAHPWLTDPAGHETQVLDDPEFFSSMLVFAGFAGIAPPPVALELLGVGASEVPEMSAAWMEILLNGMLFAHTESFGESEARLKEMRAELRRLGAIEGRRVRLLDDRSFYAALAGSLAKFGSIVDIARTESACLGVDLRMVVLADYVRAADMPRGPDEAFRPAKLGVVPIFEILRRAGIGGLRLGILTGSLVVVPAPALPALERAADECGIVAGHLHALPLAHDPNHLQVEIQGESADRIVQLVTRLFDAGEINCLVGTQALLGEGWDAPTANTLVLASYVGSYMLSNQMRGRAIRVDPTRPEKAANIWHLATIVPDTLEDELSRRFGWSTPLAPSDPVGRALGADMETLKRRFLAFEGVSHGMDVRIESGLARLGLAGREWDRAAIDALNAEMLSRAGQRPELADRWRNALGGGTVEPRRMRQISRVNHTPRLVAFSDTLHYLAVTALLGGALSAANAVRNLSSDLGMLLLVAFLGLTLFYALPKLGWALWLLVRNGTLEGSIRQVGKAVIDGLEKAGSFGRWPGEISVHSERSPRGKCLIRVENATRREERMILQAIEEILGPVGNPRYLIVRRSALGRWRRIDFHAVPSMLGQKKADAEQFAESWNRHVGGGRLAYLRNEKGRRLLLRARSRSMAAGFQRFVDRMSVWQ